LSTGFTIAASSKAWQNVRSIDRLFDRFAEATAMLTVYVFLAGVPKVSFLPVSPLFFLLPLALMLVLLTTSTPLKTVFRQLPLALAGYLLLVLTVGVLKLSPAAVVIFLTGPTLFALIFCLMTSIRGGALRLTRGVAIFYLASGAWMILSTFIPEPFASIRHFVYAGHLGRFQFSELEMAYPTGFTFGHYIMGYQLSVGLVLTLLLSYVERGRWKLFWLASSLLLAVAVILSGQRSILPALAVAFGIFLLHTRRLRLVVVLVVITGLGFGLLTEMPLTSALVQTMPDKLEKDDYSTRMSWQLAALRIIAEKPGGDLFGGLNWEQEALDQGADFAYYHNREKAVHNAYLGNALHYGWPGAVLVLLTLGYILRRLLFKVLNKRYSGCPSRPYAFTCVLALMAVMAQALFHNADLFTLEPSTWIIFCIACAWVWLMRREAGEAC
jgi:O-antigen ligase